ncbi:hypothetical protein [Gordonia sp. ABSL49_1]|uniref:hypothetical protein n=1 Tax=Gordonia sp. ABSL49_1 TaxID=2920941 RepID=UPI001F1097A3|nr:hypothetical protein [Gordonia sp. ABSL49_1]MCH5644372.1 hypothetical protein [Gordonia sp. ABSL49_1]
MAGAVAFGALVYFVPLGLFEPVMRTTNSQLTAWWNLHDVAREVGVDADQLRSALHDLEDQLDNGAAGDSTRVDELAATVRQDVIAVCRKGTDANSTLTAAQLFRAADTLGMRASKLLGVTE